jgi:hypothetical protein
MQREAQDEMRTWNQDRSQREREREDTGQYLEMQQWRLALPEMGWEMRSVRLRRW